MRRQSVTRGSARPPCRRCPHLRAVQASHEPCRGSRAAEGPRRARWRRGLDPPADDGVNEAVRSLITWHQFGREGGSRVLHGYLRDHTPFEGPYSQPAFGSSLSSHYFIPPGGGQLMLAICENTEARPRARRHPGGVMRRPGCLGVSPPVKTGTQGATTGIKRVLTDGLPCSLGPGLVRGKRPCPSPVAAPSRKAAACRRSRCQSARRCAASPQRAHGARRCRPCRQTPRTGWQGRAAAHSRPRRPPGRHASQRK